MYNFRVQTDPTMYNDATTLTPAQARLLDAIGNTAAFGHPVQTAEAMQAFWKVVHETASAPQKTQLLQS